tara:strand:+ start:792 stop:1892 length:1101 start_codon:yes stop_codon:yes gene_type:complete
MRLEELSEKSVLKYVIISLLTIMLVTIVVVISLNFDTFKNNFYDRQVETLTVIPSNKNDILRIVFTGVSTPLTPHIAQQSVVISINNKNYVFDAGSRSTANFVSEGSLEAANIEAVFITHTHSDHIGSLGELILASWGRGRTSSLPVYGVGQEIQNVVDGFNLAYKPDRDHRTAHHGPEFFLPENGLLKANLFEVKEKELLIFEDSNVKIYAFNVPHGPIHGSVGYRIIAGNRSVIISGDTDVMDNYDFVNGVDVLIHEAIIEQVSTAVSHSAKRLGNERISEIFNDINDYHANLIDYENKPGLLSRLENVDLGLLALIHIIPDKDNIIVQRALRKFKSQSSHDVVVAEINMVISLPLNSKEIIVK